MRLRFKRPSPAMAVALLALFVSLGGTTYAATGGSFLLGKPNSATSQTKLSAPIATKTLQVSNTSTASGAAGIGVNVAANHAPLVVPANAGKATNLNADKVDGMDAGALVGARAYASIDKDACFLGSPAIFCQLRREKSVSYVAHVGVGRYCVGVTGIDAAAHDSVALVNPEDYGRGGNAHIDVAAYWLPQHSACVASEFEVLAYHVDGSSTSWTPIDADFDIVIP